MPTTIVRVTFFVRQATNIASSPERRRALPGERFRTPPFRNSSGRKTAVNTAATKKIFFALLSLGKNNKLIKIPANNVIAI